MTKPLYRDPRWPKLSKATLTRDNQQCRIGLPGCTRVATQADHIVDPEEGGAPFDLANLQAACRHCNVAKRNRNVAARARRQRDRSSAGRRAW